MLIMPSESYPQHRMELGLPFNASSSSLWLQQSRLVKVRRTLGERKARKSLYQNVKGRSQTQEGLLPPFKEAASRKFCSIPTTLLLA